MTELAVYVLEQAQKAHGERLSEDEFLARFDARALRATKVRLPSIAQAMTEIRRGGQWPWPVPSEPRPLAPTRSPEHELAVRREAVLSAIRELATASQHLTYLFG